MAEHKDLTDANMHEPKGIGSATGGAADEGKVIVAKGDGTSELRRLLGGDVLDTAQTVVVQSVNDLPAPVLGEINLGSNITYLILAPITVSDRFTYGENVTIYMFNAYANTLTYTGTTGMFANATSQARLVIETAALACPNAPLLELNDAVNAGSVTMRRGRVVADTLGSMTNATALVADRMSIELISNGLLMAGVSTNPLLDLLNSEVLIGGGVFADITNITAQAIRIEFSAIIETAAGVVGLRSLGKNNVVAGSTAIVRDAFFNVTAPVSGGITSDSSRWEFRNCVGIPDSKTGVSISLATQQTVPITVAGQYEQILGGNWTADSLTENVVVSNDGIVTYVGERDISVSLTATASLDKVGGGTDIVSAVIAKNGTPITSSRGATADSGNAQGVTCIAITDLTAGDTLEIQVTNETTTADVEVEVSSFIGVRIP